MSTEGVHRKLAAILCADVEGYSRLMQDDPEGTLHTLKDHREIFRRCTEYHEGRVVDSPGDNILIEFASAIEAVQCAVEIQRELAEKNTELADNRQMRFRIGIDLGDLLEQDDALYGDGVNISARLQSLAESGGICVSGRAYDQVVNRLPLKFEFLGKRSVKNIANPIRVYRVLIQPEATSAVAKEKKTSKMVSRKLAMTTFIALIIIAAGSFIWMYSNQYRKTEQASEPEQTPAVVDVQEAPKTIAVLPFSDLSSEKDQEYFVDGLSEEILNSLAQIPDLLVTARTSSFSFKGSNKTVNEIANVLGVENVLEGSVRKTGNNLRINTQLLRGSDGFHLWSKTYDKEYKVEEMFSVQEDIATAVANELKLTLGVGESTKRLGGTDNLDAYEIFLVAKGKNIIQEGGEALKAVDAAISLDPDFALAWALKAEIHNGLSTWVASDLAASERNAAEEAAQKAIKIEPDLADGYFPLGVIKQSNGNWIEAEKLFREGMTRTPVSINPEEYGMPQRYWAVGQLTKNRDLLEVAMLTDPLNMGVRLYYLWSFAFLGDIQGLKEEYERGKELFGSQWQWWEDIMFAARICTGEILSSDEMKSLGTDPPWSEAKEHLGSPEETRAWLRQIYTENDGLSSADFSFISLYAAYFGDPELSMDAIKKCVNIEAQGIFWVWTPVFQEVRQLPRFKEFIREIGLVEYWEKFGWPDICQPTGDGDFVCD